VSKFDSSRSFQVAELLSSVLVQIRDDPVAVVATATSMDFLNTKLGKGGLFSVHVDLGPPQKDERIKVFLD
jgi:hypothetical protein